MSLKQPRDPQIWQNHDIRARREVYDSRANGAVWLLVAVGATLAMIGTDVFGTMAESLWDRMLPLLYTEALAAAVVLGFSLVSYKSESRKLGFSNFRPTEWPAAAEVLHNIGLTLAALVLATLLATLIGAFVSPPRAYSPQNPSPTPSKCSNERPIRQGPGMLNLCGEHGPAVTIEP
ncbi:hypothetical protein Slala05_79240 [Streptomyces lavendulae subsp. lavendulae]|nr:hypothetical protein Slala05_79240 [Streptomyces lavendulae subsp. lavendulae]